MRGSHLNKVFEAEEEDLIIFAAAAYFFTFTFCAICLIVSAALKIGMCEPHLVSSFVESVEASVRQVRI